MYAQFFFNARESSVSLCFSDHEVNITLVIFLGGCLSGEVMGYSLVSLHWNVKILSFHQKRTNIQFCLFHPH